MNKIAIIGASGHGKVVADIAKKNGYDTIVYLDDHVSVKRCGNYPVVGNSKQAEELNCDTIVAIGNAKIRQQIQEELIQRGVKIVSLVHPNAVIADDVSLGIGTVVMAAAVINPGAIIGDGVILNTSASVDHDCVVEDYVHVSVGAHVAGTVHIGRSTWIGAGAVVSNNVFICEECVIGAGGVVVKDITESGTYIGIPARKL